MTGQGRKIAVPLPAASILLVRNGRAGLEVLMIERAKTMRFAPGAFVFPGGKVDKADNGFWRWQGKTTGLAAQRDLAFRVAALRELYEEAAVLHAEHALPPGQANRLPLGTALGLAGTRLDTASLVPFAHWITPEPMPRRFDTHFYLAAHKGQAVAHDGSETVSCRWVCPRKLLGEWHKDSVPLMFPTRLNLMKLARASTVEQALLNARRAKVVRTLPVVNMGRDGVHLSIDPATGYGVTEASARELRVEKP